MMVKMHNFGNMSRSRVLVWGVIIVAGIFLVFGIFAWQQDRQIRYEEQRILQGLKEEFTSVHKVLSQHLAENSRTLASLKDLLLAIENGPPKDAGLVMDSALLEMTTPVTWNRGDGALDALLSSGRTKILTNSALQAKLSAWEGVLGEFLGDQDIANKMVYETHMPYFVSKNVVVGTVMAESHDDRPTREGSISNDPEAIRQLLEDSQFHVLAEVRYRFKEHLIVEIKTAIAAAEAILAEVEKPFN